MAQQNNGTQSALEEALHAGEAAAAMLAIAAAQTVTEGAATGGQGADGQGGNQGGQGAGSAAPGGQGNGAGQGNASGQGNPSGQSGQGAGTGQGGQGGQVNIQGQGNGLVQQQGQPAPGTGSGNIPAGIPQFPPPGGAQPAPTTQVPPIPPAFQENTGWWPSTQPRLFAPYPTQTTLPTWYPQVNAVPGWYTHMQQLMMPSAAGFYAPQGFSGPLATGGQPGGIAASLAQGPTPGAMLGATAPGGLAAITAPAPAQQQQGTLASGAMGGDQGQAGANQGSQGTEGGTSSSHSLIQNMAAQTQATTPQRVWGIDGLGDPVTLDTASKTQTTVAVLMSCRAHNNIQRYATIQQAIEATVNGHSVTQANIPAPLLECGPSITAMRGALPIAVMRAIMKNPATYFDVAWFSAKNVVLINAASILPLDDMGLAGVVRQPKREVPEFSGTLTEYMEAMLQFVLALHLADPAMAISMTAHISVVSAIPRRFHLSRSDAEGKTWLYYDRVRRLALGANPNNHWQLAEFSQAAYDEARAMAQGAATTTTRSGKDQHGHQAHITAPGGKGTNDERAITKNARPRSQSKDLDTLAFPALLLTSSLSLPGKAFQPPRDTPTPIPTIKTSSAGSTTVAVVASAQLASANTSTAVASVAAASMVPRLAPASTKGGSTPKKPIENWLDQNPEECGIVVDNAKVIKIPVWNPQSFQSEWDWRWSPEAIKTKCAPSPVNVVELEQLLLGTKIDDTKKKALIQGLKEGFRLGVNGHSWLPEEQSDQHKKEPTQVQEGHIATASAAPLQPTTTGKKESSIVHHKRTGIRNLVSALDHPQVVEAYIENERALGRVAGPFLRAPAGKHWEMVYVSPFGVIPKKSVFPGEPPKYRLIFHLSHGGEHAVNSRIPQELGFTRYPSFEDTATMLHAHTSDAHMALLDVEAAFRILPVHPDDLHLLVMEWKGSWFIDTRVPFGIRTGPALFNFFGDALDAILVTNNVQHLRMLDDTLVVGRDKADCSHALDTTIRLLQRLNVPIAHKKTVSPSQEVKFLGYWWSTKTRRVTLDQGRWEQLAHELSSLLHEAQATGHVTVQALRELLGKLVWASKVLPHARLNTHALFAALTQARANSIPPAIARKTWLIIGPPQVAELQWWLALASSGVKSSHEPQSRSTPGRWYDWAVQPPQPQVIAHTDASGVALGVFWSTGGEAPRWGRYMVPSEYAIGNVYELADYAAPGSATTVTVSSTWLEAAAVLAGVATWAEKWKGLAVVINCDNQAMVQSWQGGHAQSPIISAYLRAISYFCSQYDITLFLHWLPGADNCVADAISRLEQERFQLLSPLAASQAPATPPLHWAGPFQLGLNLRQKTSSALV